MSNPSSIFVKRYKGYEIYLTKEGKEGQDLFIEVRHPGKRKLVVRHQFKEKTLAKDLKPLKELIDTSKAYAN